MHLVRDLRFALRGFRSSPAATLITALTIALGVAATTTVLSVAAVLLFFAQFSFNRDDISALTTAANDPLRNWIGWAGAHVAWLFFLMFGVTAYFVPVLFLAFGLGYLFNFMGYLREHSRWSIFRDTHYRRKWS